MKDVLIFTGLIVFLALPASYLILRYFFKRSILITIGFILLVVQAVLLLLVYWVAKLGTLKDMIWAFPVGMSLMVVAYIYMNKTIRKVLKEIVVRILSLSNGDLNQSFQKKDLQRKDEIGEISNALNKMIKKLSNVISGVKSNSDNLLSASQELSATSIQLSQGANEQASSVEQVSATMEEISSNISSNTDNAKQTENMSIEANEGINEVANRASKAVESNKTILDKITVINDIAFQTNLLALNAAVEAARAGEYGKGFAVVAAEVRKLAENSKVAAEEIVKLTNESYEYAVGAGNVMKDTIPKVVETTKLVQEISSASTEQNEGANQVNNAIQQLSVITQQNASSSEELSANAEQLASQAEIMKDVISFFSLNENYSKSSINTRVTESSRKNGHSKAKINIDELITKDQEFAQNEIEEKVNPKNGDGGTEIDLVSAIDSDEEFESI